MRTHLPLFLIGAFLTCSTSLQAQTTITTNAVYPEPNNGRSNAAILTFAVQNTNSYAVNLTSLQIAKSAQSDNPGDNNTISLYYSATSLSGAPVVAAPAWDSITSTTVATFNTGMNNVFTALNFTIPANTQYRFALRATNGLAYNSPGSTVLSNTISAGGVNLKAGNAQIDSASVGYAGAPGAVTITPRYFNGAITFTGTTPLPVKLLSFDAATQGQDVILKWTATDEAAFKSYIVERADDGKTFNPVAEVSPVALKQYSYTDKHALAAGAAGTLLYRLKMVNADYSFSYSTIVSVQQQAALSGLAIGPVYPNPFTDHIAVGVPDVHGGAVKVQLIDVSGKIVAGKDYDNTEANSTITLYVYGLGTLPAGVYILRITTANGTVERQVVK